MNGNAEGYQRKPYSGQQKACDKAHQAPLLNVRQLMLYQSDIIFVIWLDGYDAELLPADDAAGHAFGGVPDRVFHSD